MDAPISTSEGAAFERGFLLGALRVEPATGEASGPGGREKLDPKVMGVLSFLAARAGHVVSREELLSALWPNAVVTDDALTRCIHELRRQLSHAGGSDDYRSMLETLPKRGYRLNARIAPLEPPQETVDEPRPRRRLLAIAAVAAAAAIGLAFALRQSADPPAGAPAAGMANSIAVLPFVDMSAARDQAHFGDGIAEEILNRLARSSDLRVIARTSSFSLRNATIGIPEIGAQLGVSHVLEGSVRKSGDQVRITAQLIAAADGAHLWSATYERGAGELFAVQDEIANAVATALEATLSGGDPRAGSPPNPQAYELFLQGRFYFNRRAPGDIDRAVGYYRDATATDPEFARAWAALAGAYNLQSYEPGADLDRLLPLQRDAARKAVALAPALAVAHARLAQYYYNVSDPEQGNRHFHTAEALDPRDPLVMGFAADRAFQQGNLDATVETWRRLVELDPLSAMNRGNYAAYLTLTGRYDEAALQIRKSLELNPDRHWDIHLELAHIHVLQRDHDAALAEIMKMPQDVRDWGMALLHGAPAHAADADAALRRLAALPPNADDVLLAELYAMRGRHDEAFAALAATRAAIEQSYARSPQLRSRIHGFQMDMLRSPHLQPLHADARWQRLLERPQGAEYEAA